MEGFSFTEAYDPLEKAQEIADQKIAAYESAREMSAVISSDAVTSLLNIVIGHVIPFV